MSYPRLVSLKLFSLAAIFGGFASVMAEPLESIPAKFDVWQDDAGFSWQVNKNGGLGSGSEPYFQNALGLFVNGGQYSPTGGEIDSADSSTSLKLNGETQDVAIRRDIHFDSVRGGVRVLDVFKNTSKATKTLRLDYKTAYQYPWQDLHGTDGKILAPGEAMSDRDFGVVVKFSQSEGRHDTLFVTSSARDAMRPDVAFSSNLRELTFTYNLTLAAGESKALAHWVMQRNLQTATDAESALRPVFTRRMLVDPNIEEGDRSLVANFSPAAFAGEGIEPFNLDALVALSRVLEDTSRSNEDILWISGKNQLAGKVNVTAALTVQSRFGERNVPIAEVAAIRGGGGIGRTPAVYLRNGEVISGAVETTGLSMKIAEGWDVEALDIADLELLMLRLGASDGKSPAGTMAYVEFRSGDVLAIDEENAAAISLEALSPWGAYQVPLSEISTLIYAAEVGAPKFRLTRKNGTILTMFLADQTFSLGGADVDTSEIAAAWSASTASSTAIRSTRMVDVTEEWIELEDVAALADLPVESVLLRGNNLIAGRFSMDALNLVAGASVTPIDANEIRRLRISEETETDRLPIFEIEMRSGEILTGRLRERVIVLQSVDGREWRVPTPHLVGFLRKEES